MTLTFFNKETGVEIKPTNDFSDLVVIDGELWDLEFHSSESSDILYEGYAYKVNQPFEIKINP